MKTIGLLRVNSCLFATPDCPQGNVDNHNAYLEACKILLELQPSVQC
jgi:hypothetical protein